MLRITGFVLLGLSGLSFLIILVVPWFGYTKGEIAGIITGLIITGEVLFYLSIFILGRSFYNKIRNFFKFRKRKTGESGPADLTAGDALQKSSRERFL